MGNSFWIRKRGGKRLIKRAEESNSYIFHLVICFTLFPQGILHLADIQLCTSNQLSLQICGDSRVALCQAFSHFQWIFLHDKKPRVTEAFADNKIAAWGGIMSPFYYEMAVLLIIQIGQTVFQLLHSYSVAREICHLQRVWRPSPEMHRLQKHRSDPNYPGAMGNWRRGSYQQAGHGWRAWKLFQLDPPCNSF